MKDIQHGSTDSFYDNSHRWLLCFFPEELSQLEHLIRRQWKEEFPLPLNAVLSLSQRARENESKGGKKRATHLPDDISIKLELHKEKIKDFLSF